MTTDPSVAICEGDFKHAWKLAADGLSTDRSNPRLAIFAAYALEQQGRPIQARMVYRQLVTANDSTRVVLACDESTVFDGKVSDVANLRQRSVERTLASLGVLVDRLDAAAEPAPVTKPAPMPAVAAKPAHTEGPKKGAWRYLAHLESYKTRKSLTRGWSKLKAAYEAELGSFSPHVETVNLGPEKGEYLRLGVVFAARDDAKSLCGMLGKAKQYCVVVKVQ